MKYGIFDISELKPIDITAFYTVFDSGWGYQNQKTPGSQWVRAF